MNGLFGIIFGGMERFLVTELLRTARYSKNPALEAYVKNEGIGFRSYIFRRREARTEF